MSAVSLLHGTLPGDSAPIMAPDNLPSSWSLADTMKAALSSTANQLVPTPRRLATQAQVQQNRNAMLLDENDHVGVSFWLVASSMSACSVFFYVQAALVPREWAVSMLIAGSVTAVALSNVNMSGSGRMRTCDARAPSGFYKNLCCMNSKRGPVFANCLREGISHAVCASESPHKICDAWACITDIRTHAKCA